MDRKEQELAQRLVAEIARLNTKKVRFMEVCGTHTVSIFRAGIRQLLPENVELVSGPGCPVPIFRRSSETTGMTSAAVPVRKHSSAT